MTTTTTMSNGNRPHPSYDVQPGSRPVGYTRRLASGGLRKSKVEELAMYLPSLLDGSDVAKVTRGGSVVLRHAWPESTDARVYDGVKAAAVRLCRDLAIKRGKTVSLYAKDWTQLEEIDGYL